MISRHPEQRYAELPNAPKHPFCRRACCRKGGAVLAEGSQLLREIPDLKHPVDADLIDPVQDALQSIQVHVDIPYDRQPHAILVAMTRESLHWGLTLLSLLLNIILLALVVTIFVQFRAVFGGMTGGGHLGMGTVDVDMDVSVDAEVPIVMSVPVRQSIRVPLKTSIPIDTRFTVPVKMPVAGTVDVTVPIEGDVPVDLMLEIPLNTTIPVDTNVPLKTTLPVSVVLDLAPILEMLSES